jgi:hypothetical protein
MVFEYLAGKFGQQCQWLSRFASEHGAIAPEDVNDRAGFDMLLSGPDGRDLLDGVTFAAFFSSMCNCRVVGRCDRACH